jgi:hypothetical protein
MYYGYGTESNNTSFVEENGPFLFRSDFILSFKYFYANIFKEDLKCPQKYNISESTIHPKKIKHTERII